MRLNFSGMKTIVATVVLIVALIAFLILNPIVIISAGERGVVLKWGAVEDVILDEGIHWVTPIQKSVKEMDVTIQKGEVVGSSASKDLQIVTTKVAVNYHLDPLKVNWVYQNFRREIDSRVVAPSIEESLKKTTARYTAEQLVIQREKVKEDLRSTISNLLKRNHVITDDVYMTDFDFSPEFNKAIEKKVTAEQNALQAKNVLEQRRYEAQQVVVAAKAEAERISIQAKSISQKGGAEYVNLKAIEKWDGKLPVQMIPNATVPFLNINARK